MAKMIRQNYPQVTVFNVTKLLHRVLQLHNMTEQARNIFETISEVELLSKTLAQVTSLNDRNRASEVI